MFSLLALPSVLFPVLFSLDGLLSLDGLTTPSERLFVLSARLLFAGFLPSVVPRSGLSLRFPKVFLSVPVVPRSDLELRSTATAPLGLVRLASPRTASLGPCTLPLSALELLGL